MLSVLSGVIILAMNRTLVEFLGLSSNASLTALGITLLGYALWLLWSARREKIKIVDAWVAVILDMVWAVGSYALLLVVRFTSGGKWAGGVGGGVGIPVWCDAVARPAENW